MLTERGAVSCYQTLLIFALLPVLTLANWTPSADAAASICVTEEAHSWSPSLAHVDSNFPQGRIMCGVTISPDL